MVGDSERRTVIEHGVDGTAGVGGVVWKLPHEGDLDGNLVRLAAHRSIDEHVNDDVDVFVVVRDGGGELVVDGERHRLGDRSIALVPRGSSRSLTAGPDGITYLGIHRRRDGLTITERPA